MQEERIFNITELQILFNIPGNFIHFIREERQYDGSVIYYELDTGEEVDLESYAIHGYKLIKNKDQYLNPSKEEYTYEEIVAITEEHDGLFNKYGRNYLDDGMLADLHWLMDFNEQSRYSFNLQYPVEQIEVRYSEILDDYLFLYVTFDLAAKRLVYMDMITGNLVKKEVLDLYTYFPRDDLFHKESYSPNDIIKLKKELQRVRTLGKRRNG